MTTQEFKRAIRIKSSIKDKQRQVKMINNLITSPDINKVRVGGIEFALDMTVVLTKLNEKKVNIEQDIANLEQEFNLI